MALRLEQLRYFGQVGKAFRELPKGICVERKCKLKRLYDNLQYCTKYEWEVIYIEILAVQTS
jgi:hypothetical protein